MKTPIQQKKQALRHQTHQELASLFEFNKKSAALKAAENFVKLMLRKKANAKYVAIFAADDSEISTRELFCVLKQHQKTTYFPTILGEDIYFTEVKSWSDLSEGKFGILAPAFPGRAYSPTIDMIAIPGVNFDVFGARLGRGKGFYDRFLKKQGSATFKVGYSYDFQLRENIFSEPHDEKVDAVVTERRIVII